MSRTPLSGFPEWLPAAADDRAARPRPDPARPSSCTASRRWRPARSSRWTSCCARARPPRRSTCCAGCRPTPTAPAGDDALGLHFDLTVPFARYVLENAGKLQFPFRRYQIQKVWRGERPQEGRYREFLQADIDVVDRDTLPSHYEAEMPLVIGDALRRRCRSRRSASRSTTARSARASTGARARPTRRRRCAPSTSSTRSARRRWPSCWPRRPGRPRRRPRRAWRWPRSPPPDASFADAVRALGVSDPLLDEGLAELVAVVETAARARARALRGRPEDRPRAGLLHRHRLRDAAARLRAVRLDLLRRPVRQPGHRRHRPVPGRRHLDRRDPAARPALRGRARCRSRAAVPTCVLVAVVPSEEQRRAATRIADGAAPRGIPTEVSPTAAKFGKQIRYAERRGIPYVWFPGADGADRSRTSAPASRSNAVPGEWTPPAGGPASRWSAESQLLARTPTGTYGGVSYATVGRPL